MDLVEVEVGEASFELLWDSADGDHIRKIPQITGRCGQFVNPSAECVHPYGDGVEGIG